MAPLVVPIVFAIVVVSWLMTKTGFSKMLTRKLDKIPEVFKENKKDDGGNE